MKKPNNSKLFPLNEGRQQILNSQVISKEHPGSILVDFNMMLDFIGEKEMETGGKYGFFPMGKLADINSKLTHSIRLASQRPQQKAFPHIHGLYLLLRSTGIVYLKTIEKKRYLLLDEKILQSWNGLNPTEQYFNLLEAWLLQGNEQIILEHDRGFPNHLVTCHMFLKRFDKGKIYKPDQKRNEFSYTPGWHNVALLQMFGFITIKQPQKNIDKFWLIDQIRCADFGRVMIPLLDANIIERDLGWKIIDGENLHFGEWQSLLQPFFPEWKNNLITIEPEFQEGLYIFKIAIGSVWRRIAISGDQELELLSDAILEAFDFDNNHLYQFTYKNRKGLTASVNAPELEEPPFTTEVLVGELNLNPGDSLIYLYDFGDQWKFSLILEKIDTNNTEKSTPILLESHGESPEQWV